MEQKIIFSLDKRLNGRVNVTMVRGDKRVTISVHQSKMKHLGNAFDHMGRSAEMHDGVLVGKDTVTEIEAHGDD